NDHRREMPRSLLESPPQRSRDIAHMSIIRCHFRLINIQLWRVSPKRFALLLSLDRCGFPSRTLGRKLLVPLESESRLACSETSITLGQWSGRPLMNVLLYLFLFK